MNRQARAAAAATHAVLLPASLLMLAPLAWMISTSLKQRWEVFTPTPQWLPADPGLAGYREALGLAPFGTYFVNSVIVTAAILCAQWVTIVLAAYAFARLRFRGSGLLFLLFLVQMLIPPQATFVPNFLTMRALGLVDTRLAIVLPFLASGYGTFLLRQQFKTVPLELEEAAKLDGCGALRFIWHVLVPLSRPTLIAFSLVSLIAHWNDYFWPLIVTNSPEVRTLPIGLGMFVQQESGADWTVLMAATVFVCAPLLGAFVFFQRRFIQSFMQTGLKG